MHHCKKWASSPACWCFSSSEGAGAGPCHPPQDEAWPLILRAQESHPPGLGIWASSQKQKSIARNCQVRKYILATSGFRKRLLFPLGFPSLHAGATSLEIPAYGGGEITKTANKGIKTIVNNVSNGYPFSTLKCYKNLRVVTCTFL